MKPDSTIDNAFMSIAYSRIVQISFTPYSSEGSSRTPILQF